MGFFKEQEKKEANVIFGIKKRAFFKQQLHTMHRIHSGFQWLTVSFIATDQYRRKIQFDQRSAYFIDTLVGGKVVYYRNYYLFHVCWL